MKLSFKTGTGTESIQVKDEQILSVLNPVSLPSGLDESRIIQDALHNPIGTEKLHALIHPHEKTVIVISDLTRPCPSYRFLPSLIDELHAAGLSDSDIEIVIARGSHRKCTEEEIIKLVGRDLCRSINVINSGDHGYTHIGTTKRGTPVDIDTDVIQAAHRILTGNVEFHYFAGFSGGAKAFLPGCCDPDCIAFNHRLMTDENARAGKLLGNPVREDIEEAAGMTTIDFIFNVILNTRKEIIDAYCGDLHKAHRKACQVLSDLYLSPIPDKADIVIVSQGGSPKDLNLYQTQKALDNAKYAVKDNGVIILIGSCKEGFGNPVFEQWMRSYQDPDEMIHALHDHFILGGHKAAAIAMVRKKADIFLVSDMNPKELEHTVLQPYQSLRQAYDTAVRKCGENATIIAMPYGGSTLPVLK